MKKKFSKIRRKHSIKQHNRRITMDCVRRLSSNISYINKSSQSDTDVSYNETEGCIEHNLNDIIKFTEPVDKENLSEDILHTVAKNTNNKQAPESPKVLVTSPTASSSIESLPTTYEVIQSSKTDSELITDDNISISANNDFSPNGETCSKVNSLLNEKLPDIKQESNIPKNSVKHGQETIKATKVAKLPELFETDSNVFNEQPPTVPPTEEEIVKRILANDPVMPYMDPNSSLYKQRKQRKRHGYLYVL